MKCAFCGEEFEGTGYKITNDVRITGVKTNAVNPVMVIKDIGNVCSRACQLASKIAFVIHSTPNESSDEALDKAFRYCNCNGEEFENGMERYREVMDRKIYMVENDYKKDL